MEIKKKLHSLQVLKTRSKCGQKIPCTAVFHGIAIRDFKDVPTSNLKSNPKSNLLGVTVALIHVAAQHGLAV